MFLPTVGATVQFERRAVDAVAGTAPLTTTFVGAYGGQGAMSVHDETAKIHSTSMQTAYGWSSTAQV
ncbi:hypothetical protein, partial [Streptococcus pneumoniae]|uniref:hypothetical protein n=1 Tax=Streptococcus pneumoniae TaxID=1313 RepID=UPI0018B01995